VAPPPRAHIGDANRRRSGVFGWRRRVVLHVAATSHARLVSRWSSLHRAVRLAAGTTGIVAAIRETVRRSSALEESRCCGDARETLAHETRSAFALYGICARSREFSREEGDRDRTFGRNLAWQGTQSERESDETMRRSGAWLVSLHSHVAEPKGTTR